MTSLQSVQLWGTLTKIVTLALGILQTALILRILSVEEYGVVGIIVSLGSLVGVSQHVGIVDAAIREIAVATDALRRAYVFWVSLWFRLAVTVPVSIVFALLGEKIGAAVYRFPDVPYLVRLTSVILVLQGIQGVVGGAYTGQRAFGSLYALQFAMAVVNVALFAGFTWWRGVPGFFEAVILSTFLFILLLSFFLKRALGGILTHPGSAEMRQILRDIVHTGAWTYVARILSVAWQRVPILLLGRWAAPEAVGLFNVALTFGSKLIILAAALGEVNLAFLSHAFAMGRQAFVGLARRTLTEVGAVILLGVGILGVFADVLLRLFAGDAYVPAAGITALVTIGYGLFAFLDISANSVFVPARLAQFRAYAFAALLVGTLGVMFLYRANPVAAAAWGTVAGGVAGVAGAALLARVFLGMTLFSRRDLFLLVPAVALLFGMTPHVSVSLRIVLVFFSAVVIVRVAFPSLARRMFFRRSFPSAAHET